MSCLAINTGLADAVESHRQTYVWYTPFLTRYLTVGRIIAQEGHARVENTRLAPTTLAAMVEAMIVEGSTNSLVEQIYLQ